MRLSNGFVIDKEKTFGELKFTTQLPIFSVQYHPEASPGPDDNRYLFDQFWAMLQKGE